MFTKAKIFAAGIAAAGALTAGQAQAAVVMFTSNTVGPIATNFSDVLNIQKFDSSLGTLQSVFITLYGQIEGTIGAENLSGSAASIDTDLFASLTLSRPGMGGGVIVITSPLAVNTFNLGAFDGTIDFGGASGQTVQGVMANDSDSATLNSGADLALFSGTGVEFLAAPLTALGFSNVSGGGNATTMFSTFAQAYAEVTYTYSTLDTGIPEPATWAMMIGGFGAAGAVLRRKRTLTAA